jgi:hypothetical protein
VSSLQQPADKQQSSSNPLSQSPTKNTIMHVKTSTGCSQCGDFHLPIFKSVPSAEGSIYSFGSHDGDRLCNYCLYRIRKAISAKEIISLSVAIIIYFVFARNAWPSKGMVKINKPAL